MSIAALNTYNYNPVANKSHEPPSKGRIIIRMGLNGVHSRTFVGTRRGCYQ